MLIGIVCLLDPCCAAIFQQKMLDIFTDAALKWNNPAAQYYIECIYLKSKLGVKRNETLAVYWLSLAANNGWSDAIARLAIAYFHGTLFERNYEKAVFWFEKIVAKYENKTKNCMDNQLFLFDNEKFELKIFTRSHEASMGLFLEDITYTALPILFCRTLIPPSKLRSELKQIYIWSSFTNKKSASLAISHYYLARLYSSEEFNDIDIYSRHMQWLEKAAKNNKKDAILLMGAAYENGIIVKRDYKEAMKWYEKAYRLVGAKEVGAVGIGRLYQTGKGVEKNHEMALNYYQEAKESHTFYPPYYIIGEIYRNGDGDDLEVFEYFSISLEYLNDPKGLTGMAAMYHGPKFFFIVEALRYRNGGLLRCPQAQYDLGEMYSKGYLRSKEHLEIALQLFKKSEAGDYEAAKPMIALVEKQLLYLPTR